MLSWKEKINLLYFMERVDIFSLLLDENICSIYDFCSFKLIKYFEKSSSWVIEFMNSSFKLQPSILISFMAVLSFMIYQRNYFNPFSRPTCRIPWFSDRFKYFNLLKALENLFLFSNIKVESETINYDLFDFLCP